MCGRAGRLSGKCSPEERESKCEWVVQVTGTIDFIFFRRDDIENSFMKIVGHYSKNDVQIIINGEFFLHVSYHISVFFVPAAIELSNNIKLTIEMHWNMA